MKGVPRLWFIRRMYDWTLRWAGHRHAPRALFAIAFIESSIFLIPPDALMVPMVLSRPHAWVRYALIATIGSVLGGIFGYYIGYALWESVGKSVVDFYHLQASVEAVRVQYEHHAFLANFSAAFTPIPYKVFTIASGLFRVSLFDLVAASLIGRALRFFLIAGLVGRYGKRVKTLIDDYFDILTIIAIVLFVGGFIVIQWMV